MADKKRRTLASFALVAVMIYAAHIYAEHLAYKTGIYMGKTSFQADDFQNRQCLSLRRDALEPICEVKDMGQDSVMEDALASAYITPSFADSKTLHTGFRDGWREARTATFADR